jgi:glutamate 5-kinase
MNDTSNFDRHDIVIAQALLTKADLSDRIGYLNARNTLLNLLELNIIGIINENDVVAIDELHEAKFGDNDNLSAMVANLIDADLLLILTDIAGLYTADPRCNPNATLIKRVEKITPEIETLAGNTGSNIGTGGMITKIEAAKLANSSGIPVVIASGHEPDIIERITCGEEIGTLFVSASKHCDSRKRWMVSGLCIKGKLTIEGGAVSGLKEKNGSLLAAEYAKPGEIPERRYRQYIGCRRISHRLRHHQLRLLRGRNDYGGTVKTDCRFTGA